LTKTNQSKQSFNRRKFAQSGHPASLRLVSRSFYLLDFRPLWSLITSMYLHPSSSCSLCPYMPGILFRGSTATSVLLGSPFGFGTVASMLKKFDKIRYKYFK
jgi:hypothetical protein